MGFSVFKAKKRTAGRREKRKANVNAWDETDKMADQKASSAVAYLAFWWTMPMLPSRAKLEATRLVHCKSGAS